MNKSIDNPVSNDNRNYDYTLYPSIEREEYNIICEMVESGSRIIDLGCGNGSLIEKLIKEKKVSAAGLEISKSGVDACLKKGLNVFSSKIDEPLQFEDNSFDYAICNVTIQMVNYPEVLIKEMKRISKYQIISFPNFGFYKNRFDLLLNGRMPRPMLFKYTWYNTGHIHQLSIKDFYNLLNDVGHLKIINHDFVKTESELKNYFLRKMPNFFQSLPVFLLEKINN